MLKHEEAESSLVGLLLRCKQQYFCLLLNNFTVSTSTSPTMPWPKSSGFLGAVHCHYQGFWKKKLITLADQMYFNLRTCHNSHFKGRSQTERFFSPFGYICSVFTAFFNGATIRENIWSFCMRINSINNNRDYVCTADGNEAPRLYILVPEAKPWGLTNQPGFLVSSISMELAVTWLQVREEKRQKLKAQHWIRRSCWLSKRRRALQRDLNRSEGWGITIS